MENGVGAKGGQPKAYPPRYTMMHFPHRASKLLPADAREMLIMASRAMPDVPYGESPLREDRVLKATAQVKILYPQFFRKREYT